MVRFGDLGVLDGDGEPGRVGFADAGAGDGGPEGEQEGGLGNAYRGRFALEVEEELGASVHGCSGGADAGVAQGFYAVAGDELCTVSSANSI